MNIEPITMDIYTARKHAREYAESVRAERQKRIAKIDGAIKKANALRVDVLKEDEILLASYRALARGKRLIDLRSALKHAGLQPSTGLPALAVASPLWKVVRLHLSSGRVAFHEETGNRWLHFNTSQGRFNVKSYHFPLSIFPPEFDSEAQRKEKGWKLHPHRAAATVPSIPARFRPSNLENYTILWDPIWTRRAPIDPILLRHVAGSIYSIVAQWDLTPIERAVIDMRLPNE